MVPASSPAANLARTIAHAVDFLTSPLISSYPTIAVSKLQLVLEANLTALFAPTWLIKDSFGGSDRRSISLSPHSLPPRPVYAACIAAGVQWFEWISLLGNREFQLCVNPGHVAIRYIPNGELLTVWFDQQASRNLRTFPRSIDVHKAMLPYSSKTLAQQLLEDDRQADDQLFALIADEINAPTWVTPVNPDFPSLPRPLSPVPTFFTHSRCSSRSSNSSSGFSYASGQSSATSLSTASFPANMGYRQSRRDKARHTRIFVDTSKVDVTPYDGGKTTVLTGGVMLGAAHRLPAKMKVQHPW